MIFSTMILSSDTKSIALGAPNAIKTCLVEYKLYIPPT